MGKIKVSIIILNFNGKQDTIECLHSLNQLKKSSITTQIYVVDNASSDNSILEIKKSFPDLHMIINEQNLGFSGGNNIGIRKALSNRSDFILLLNNDTTVKPNFLEELVTAAEKQKADLLSPKIYFSPGREFHKQRYQKQELGKVLWYAGGLIDWKNVHTSHRGVDEIDTGQFDHETSNQFATGCAMFIRTKVFKSIGMLDGVYFAYFEDADFSVRAVKAGFNIGFASKAIIWHKNASSFKGSGSEFQDYFISKNRIYFGLRYAPLKSKLALMRQAVGYIIQGPRSKRRAMLDAFFNRTPDHRYVKALLRN